jgi:hypothetical protein
LQNFSPGGLAVTERLAPPRDAHPIAAYLSSVSLF